MPRRPCLGCKRLIPRGSLCTACRARRDADRARFEPWRRVYQTAEWAQAQRACLYRDGGQCRAAVTPTVRCPETQHLQAHHLTPLRESWAAAAGDWDVFVSAATRVDELVSVCSRHHAQAEAALRRASRAR